MFKYRRHLEPPKTYTILSELYRHQMLIMYDSYSNYSQKARNCKSDVVHPIQLIDLTIVGLLPSNRTSAIQVGWHKFSEDL